MKKAVFVLCFLFVIVLSCKSKNEVLLNVEKKEINYIPYYLKVYEADSLYIVKDYKKSYKILDSLFKIYEPLNSIPTYEIEIYCELTANLKTEKKLDKYLTILVSEYGYDIANMNDSLWINIKSNASYSNIEFKKMYSEFVSKINLELRDSIYKLFREDQAVRKLGSRIKIDSFDRKNENRTVNIIREYGYPTVKMIGGHAKDSIFIQNYISVLLKHISWVNLKTIEPLLLDDIKRGKCPPFVYAEMLDVRKVVAKEETPFDYFGSFKNKKPDNIIKTNQQRKKIGLAKTSNF